MGLLIGTGLAAAFLFEVGGLEGLLGHALLLSAALWLGLKAGWVLDLPRSPASRVPAPHGLREAEVVKVKEKQPEKSVSLLDMVEIPGGDFLMRSTRHDDSAYESEFPQHRVTVCAFWMSRFPVTVEQYKSVMKDIPSAWSNQASDDRYPANSISWFEAISFCNALSEREGFEPCYKIEGESVEWLRNAQGYRLPTEAEWEYAARAGTQSRYFFGDDPAMLGEFAFYSRNSRYDVHPVGLLKPNPFGLTHLCSIRLVNSRHCSSAIGKSLPVNSTRCVV
ncbi:MAG: formylglycine-generating enzyme family protein [Methylococcales bacterium]